MHAIEFLIANYENIDIWDCYDRSIIDWLIDWLMLLESRPDLRKKILYSNTKVLPFLDVKSQVLKKNNNVLLFSFPFYNFIPVANLWFIRLQG